MTLLEKIQNRKAIIYGRFQPLSKAHYNMIKNAVDQYQEVFVFPVQGPKAYVSDRKTQKGKTADLSRKMQRNPLPAGMRSELILKAIPELDSKHVLRSYRGSVEHIIDLLEKMYPSKDFSKLDVWAGEDEYPEYVRQVEAMANKDEYKDYNIDVYKYEEGTRVRTAGGEIESTVSGTQLRSYITLPDKTEAFTKYKELIAPPLANQETFQKLRRALKKIQKLDIEESFGDFASMVSEESNGHKDIIRKGHFKNYDKYYYSGHGNKTGQSDTEGDASSRVANSKMVDDVQKHLWKNAKVDDEGNYVIPASAWKEFKKALAKDIKKYGAKGQDAEGEGDI